MAKAVQIAAIHSPIDTSAITIKEVNLSSRRWRAGFLNNRAPARPREKSAPSNRSLLSTISSLPVQFWREISAEERCIGQRQGSVLGWRSHVERGPDPVCSLVLGRAQHSSGAGEEAAPGWGDISDAAPGHGPAHPARFNLIRVLGQKDVTRPRSPRDPTSGHPIWPSVA
jgi:hypothetical protein